MLDMRISKPAAIINRPIMLIVSLWKVPIFNQFNIIEINKTVKKVITRNRVLLLSLAVLSRLLAVLPLRKKVSNKKNVARKIYAITNSIMFLYYNAKIVLL